MRKRLALLLAATVVAAGGLSATAHADPAPPPAPHRITADGDRLIDSVTGATFTPRGANYVRLDKSPDGMVYHSTFEPGRYNSAAARAMFAQMKNDGYNTVRVFIDHGRYDRANVHGIGGGPGTTDFVSGPYMDDFADFVELAAEHGIYVMPAMDYWPQNDFYYGIINQGNAGTAAANMNGENINYMSPGRVAAKAEYVKRFAEALAERVGEPRTATILAYSANNEAFFEGDKAPFNATSGGVTPLNGVTYDMAIASQRQQAADASIVEYTHRIRRALDTVDADALLAIGAFTPQAVQKPGFNGLQQPPGVTNKFFPARLSALSRFGAVDFVDVHLYPDSPTYQVAADLQTAEAGQFAKPYIVGEMGAMKRTYDNDVRKAAIGMRDTMAATCQAGAQGWLFWTWDTTEDLASQREFFTLTESGGAINGQLAPTVRRLPCLRAVHVPR